MCQVGTLHLSIRLFPIDTEATNDLIETRRSVDHSAKPLLLHVIHSIFTSAIPYLFDGSSFGDHAGDLALVP